RYQSTGRDRRGHPGHGFRGPGQASAAKGDPQIGAAARDLLAGSVGWPRRRGDHKLDRCAKHRRTVPSAGASAERSGQKQAPVRLYRGTRRLRLDQLSQQLDHAQTFRGILSIPQDKMVQQLKSAAWFALIAGLLLLVGGCAAGPSYNWGWYVLSPTQP